jgi:hypothetical protein
MRVSRRSGTDLRCSLYNMSAEKNKQVEYILTFGLKGASFPPMSALLPKVVQDRLACYPRRPWILAKPSVHPRFAFESHRGDSTATNGGEEPQQTLGSVLDGGKKIRGYIIAIIKHLLSTEPLRAFDSIFFVRRNEFMSFPTDVSSRSSRARSTLLN